MATSDDNAAHQILIKDCVSIDLIPIQTKIDMKTLDRHKPLSWTFTWLKRFKDG